MKFDVLNRSQMYKAQKITNRAVRDGLITKPRRCSKCKKVTPYRSLHLHHRNYAKPLDVVWLCNGCHADTHKVIRFFERSAVEQ